jgi:hypothetical protein
VRGEAALLAVIRQDLASDLAARVVRQRMDIDVRITIPNVCEEL